MNDNRLPSQNILICDTETFCAVDIKTAGTVKYATAAEMILAGYKLNGRYAFWDYSIDQSQPVWVQEHINSGGKVAAHNALFDYLILKKHFPTLQLSQMIDTQAIVAAHNLPLSLDKSSEALDLPVKKYKGGSRLIRKFCIPRKPTKLNKTTRNVPQMFPKEWKEFRDVYLKADVETVEAILNRLGLLSAEEQQVWLDTQYINVRGIPIDLHTVHQIVDQLSVLVDDESSRFIRIAGVFPTQRDKVLAWLDSQGYPLENMQAPTVAKAIADEKAPQHVRDALEARANTTHMAFKKFNTMINAAMEDEHVRGTLMYHASSTGRFGGRLLQPQNLTRGTIDGEEAVASIHQGEFNVELVKSAVRPMIYHPDGFTIVDYSSIEARSVQYLAMDENALDVFRQGKDPYIEMATKIFGVLYDDVTDKQRWHGKQAILGLGYQMGAKKFVMMVEQYGQKLSMTESKRTVEVYRDVHRRLVKFWDSINKCAIKAMQLPSTTVRLNQHIAFTLEDEFLFMHLPSGRRLAYYKPNLDTDKFGLSLSYMSMNHQHQYVRTHTYGGKLCENLTQAFARDILTTAVHKLMNQKLDVVFHVHDEVVLRGKHPVEWISSIMCEEEDWYRGLPLEAEGETVNRYRKL